MTLARSAGDPSLRNCSVNAGVVQVKIGNENVQECFCSMYSMLNVLNVLRCGVSPSVRGLVVCAFCSSHVLAWSSNEIVALLTIAVDSAMRTRLFAVAFDLLPPTFVASPGNPAPLLEMRSRFGTIELAGGVGRCLRLFQLGHYIIVARLDLAEPVVVLLRRYALHSLTASPGQDPENDDLRDALRGGQWRSWVQYRMRSAWQEIGIRELTE